MQHSGKRGDRHAQRNEGERRDDDEITKNENEKMEKNGIREVRLDSAAFALVNVDVESNECEGERDGNEIEKREQNK